MGLRYQFISTPPVILLITRGTQLFFLFCFVFVGRDVRGGSPNWPGRAFVFRGGYHPRKTSPGKTSCKSTVGANRMAGPIMS